MTNFDNNSQRESYEREYERKNIRDIKEKLRKDTSSDLLDIIGIGAVALGTAVLYAAAVYGVYSAMTGSSF